MPIRGLSERRRLPRLGKIRIGEQVESKTKAGVFYPKAVDHFVVPPEVAKVYGDNTKSLDILFPVEDANVFAPQFYKAYSQTRGLVCRGDGESASRLVDLATRQVNEKTGEVLKQGNIARATAKNVEWVEDIPCPGRGCPYYQAKQCREIMNLQFMLPRVPGLGVWQLDTSSINSITNINSALAVIRQAFRAVAGVPLELTVEPAPASPEGKKKTIYVLNLRSPYTLYQLAKMRTQPLFAILPPSDEERPDLLYPTPEQEAARAEDEKAEAPTQAQGDIGTLYPTPQPPMEPVPPKEMESAPSQPQERLFR